MSDLFLEWDKEREGLKGIKIISIYIDIIAFGATYIEKERKGNDQEQSLHHSRQAERTI